MSDWQSIEHHRFRYQGEVLFFEPHGELSLSQAETWSQVIAAHFQRERHGFLLIDARDLKPPASAVRRMFLTLLKDIRPRPRIIVFGANLVIRTVSRLVLAAAWPLFRLELDLTQYATESEAWAHVEQLRQLSQLSSPLA